jgi:Type II CAAX prenyl endopeptidase Rce1-like
LRFCREPTDLGAERGPTGAAGFRHDLRAGDQFVQSCPGFDPIGLLRRPVDYSQSHSTVEAMLGVINIVPLGLLWGYLTHRTGSFLPSMLLHGLNFWGLQNF